MDTAKTIRHSNPECDDTTTYKNGECKSCKNIKNNKYLKSEKGMQIKEKSVVKQRLARRRGKIRDIVLEVEDDMNILGITDEKYKKSLEEIKTLIQLIEDINLRKY